MSPLIRVGVDTGGTFTDIACMGSDGHWHRWKEPSTPDDPARAILAGLNALLPDAKPEAMEIVHGTTVGTNAFLERKGARTVLITTKGFEDILWIGRQARPKLYDLMVSLPPEIISRRQVVGISERLDWKGQPLVPLVGSEAGRALRFCRARGAQSVAVCLLHSYVNPVHERMIEKKLSSLGIPVCISSRVLPEFREYERLTTTLINAYLAPAVGDYVGRLGERLPGARIFIQQSNGGCRPARGIGAQAVHTLLSGPAGGVQAAWRLSRDLGFNDIITLDMGGTSTDVSLCPGRLTYTRDYRIDNFPVAIPLLDIHTVGAGGGSIAWIDAGGILKVGPQSAGADPGPACYGTGEEVTVTDANLFLGRLRPESFLKGRMRLYPDRVGPRLQKLGGRLGLSAHDTALGILRLVNTSMVQAIRAVTLERGYDPRRCMLVSFGGASGLHAAELAGELGIKRILIPARAGVFSAQGMAEADLMLDSSMAFLTRKARNADAVIQKAMNGLIRRMTDDIAGLGLAPGKNIFKPALDVRYEGQSFELTIPWGSDWKTLFSREHRRLYGYDLPGNNLEVTALRLMTIIPRKAPGEQREAPAPGYGDDAPSGARSALSKVRVHFRDGARQVPVFHRRQLSAGSVVEGAAIILDDFTTILVPPGWISESLGAHLLLTKCSCSQVR